MIICWEIAKPFKPQDVCQPGRKSAGMILSIKKLFFLCAAKEFIFEKIDYKRIKLANFDPTNLRLNLKNKQTNKKKLEHFQK